MRLGLLRINSNEFKVEELKGFKMFWSCFFGGFLGHGIESIVIFRIYIYIYIYIYIKFIFPIIGEVKRLLICSLDYVFCSITD